MANSCDIGPVFIDSNGIVWTLSTATSYPVPMVFDYKKFDLTEYDRAMLHGMRIKVED